MKASGILSSLLLLAELKRAVFVWGPPGVGKSDVVRQFAKQKNTQLKDIRVLLHDNVDFKGLPYLEQGQTKWAIPDFLPRDGEGILFLDELNAAPALVQAACYELILDRRLGDYRLPDGWVVLAAGNREVDRSVVTRMPTALRNRFIHLDFEVDGTEWKKWAFENNIRFEVIAFLEFKPDLLHQFDRDANAFPSPRSWAFVSDILTGNPSKIIELELIAGAVGAAAATEFIAFLNTYRALPNIDAILLDPDSATLPSRPDEKYAVACALSHRATDTNIDRVCKYLNRMPAEFSVLCVTDAIRRTPTLQQAPAFTKWATKHNHLLN